MEGGCSRPSSDTSQPSVDLNPASISPAGSRRGLSIASGKQKLGAVYPFSVPDVPLRSLGCAH
eukprot:4813737-Pyramimonas_sp.AAC.1